MQPFQQLTEQKLTAILDRLRDEENFIFLETTRLTPENSISLLFLHPVDTLVCRVKDDPALFFEQLESRLRAGYHVVGWLAYELGYLFEPVLNRECNTDSNDILAEMLIVKEPYIYDHEAGSFRGKTPWSDTLPSLNSADRQVDQEYAITSLQLNQSRDNYISAIHKIKDFIAAGDTYQVNYTLKYKFKLSGSLTGLYKTLRRNQSVSYGAFLKTPNRKVISFSPELFFKKNGRTCLVKPMKGTIKRGQSLEQDRGNIDFLRNDPKNRSENVMIVDLLRNDLGRLCQMGGVTVSSLFDVETYETLHQMTSTIKGNLKKNLSYAAIFKAIFPSGSITGAPKIRTMQIIRELELEPRGIYTGAIGYISPNGNAQFNVPIRTVVVAGEQCEMGVGSGIVFDSDPQAEWEECCLKGRFLTNPSIDFALIETLLWIPGQGYWLLDLHLDRLISSARYFDFPISVADLINQLEQRAGSFSNNPQRVRVTLARHGQVTVSENSCPLPKVSAMPDNQPADVATFPLAVIAKESTDSSSVFLYHKTTQRPFYSLERERALAKGYFEVIFTNEHGEITEGSITSIFIKNGNMLYTPPIDRGLLPGIFRRYLLERFPDQVQEKILTRTDLDGADAIYVGNSVRGLVRVRLCPPNCRQS